MTNDHVMLQSLVEAVTRALSAAGYASEPDPSNNTSNAPAYLKVFCKDLPKRRRVDYVNLVFGGLAGEQVRLEGEEKIYTMPGDVKALVERVQ
ncbi:MAG TPA: hypothetical protein VIV60_33765, partial [Polyangiaceae bacterium]